MCKQTERILAQAERTGLWFSRMWRIQERENTAENGAIRACTERFVIRNRQPKRKTGERELTEATTVERLGTEVWGPDNSVVLRVGISLFASLVGWLTGLEPATPGITIRCSNQLSYSHHIREEDRDFTPRLLCQSPCRDRFSVADGIGRTLSESSGLTRGARPPSTPFGLR